MFKGLFGPGQNEIWSQLAEEVGGEFIKGSFTKPSRVETQLKEWTIILDTYTVSDGKTSTIYTRMRVPYITTEGFYFKIYNKNIFSNIGKIFNLQDVKTGDEVFDEAFIIKGNNEEKIMELFSRESLRYLISKQKHFSLEVKEKEEGIFRGKLPEKVRLLEIQCLGVIKDKEKLKQLYLLVSEGLNQLCEIGIALENDPQITLKT